jgi:hypothetical protein
LEAFWQAWTDIHCGGLDAQNEYTGSIERRLTRCRSWRDLDRDRLRPIPENNVSG